jgi:hypothetical protein
MTGYRRPPLAVVHDAQWVEVDLAGDLAAWARDTATDILDRAGGSGPGRAGASRLAALLEGAGGLARGAGDAVIALLLFPTLPDGIVAVIRFCLFDLAGRDEADAWAELMFSLADAEDGAEPPEVTDLATPAGTCRRIRQRYLYGESRDRPVGEQYAYVWVFPQYGAGAVMTTGFTDLVEAGRWRPALDALAGGVELGTPRAGG